MKTKYRIKEVTDGYGTQYFVQYKFFLFWHYFLDGFGDPYNYYTVSDANKAIAKERVKKKVTYINED